MPYVIAKAEQAVVSRPLNSGHSCTFACNQGASGSDEQDGSILGFGTPLRPRALQCITKQLTFSVNRQLPTPVHFSLLCMGVCVCFGAHNYLQEAISRMDG